MISLMAGPDNDTYQFGIFDGHDVIVDDHGLNRIEFDHNISQDMVRFVLGEMGDQPDPDLAIGDLRIEIFDPANPGTVFSTIIVRNFVQSSDDGDSTSIATFVFDDGTEFSAEEFLTNFASDGSLIIATGDAGSNVLSGFADDDYIVGHGGDDILNGNEGNDVLDGGQGRDQLYGGLGDDIYVFGRGYGADFINDTATEIVNTTYTETYIYYETQSVWIEAGENSHWETQQVAVEGTREVTGDIELTVDAGDDVLLFEDGITHSDILMRINNGHIELALKNPLNPSASFESLRDKITIANWEDPNQRVETITFSSGLSISIAFLVDFFEITEGGIFTDLSRINELLDDQGNLDPVLMGTEGVDTITGTDDDETIIGGDGDDVLSGGAGDD